MIDDRTNTEKITEQLSLEDCELCDEDDNLTPIEKWIKKSPQSRNAEVEFLSNAEFGYQMQITPSGELQQPLAIGNWTFLMVLDKSFPKETENHEIPIKVCLAVPNSEEIKKQISRKKIPYVSSDSNGVDYLYFSDFKQEYHKYLNGQHNKLLTETLLNHTYNWASEMIKFIEEEKSRKASINRGIRTSSFLGFLKQSTSPVFFNYGERRPKYLDARRSFSDGCNPKCKKVVLSDRAYIQIFNESQSRIQTETGGLLLGHYDEGVWYVVEASDPGINAKFYNAYHEGDDVYENHVCGVISRTYKHPLVFLGMWHRHPGSLDSFSGTDDRTNYKYAGSAGNGCISAIINYDPDFRITFYYVEQAANHQVYYTKVDVEVGDNKIPNKEMLKIASINDVIQRR